MGLSDYNPLEYFKELTLFSRTVFLLGFITLFVGIAHGANIYNRTVFAGIGAIMFALSCHYFATSRWHDIEEPYASHFYWGVLLRAFVLLMVAVAFAVWSYLIPAAKSTEAENKPQQTAIPVQASQTVPESKPVTEPKPVKKTTPDSVRGTVNQKGDKNIAQIGSNNQATINPDVDPNKPVVTYDFNGVKRTTSLGNVTANTSGMDVFAQMMAKSESRDWNGVAVLAEQTKPKSPEWLTPYFMAGEAYLNLCESEKAHRNLEHFVEKAKGVPTFEDAVTAAETDLNNLKAGKVNPNCKGKSPSTAIPDKTKKQGIIVGDVQQHGNGNVSQIGYGNSATVNNFVPPARRIVNQQAFIECLKAKPGKFSVGAIMNNTEAYNYAKDWHDVFVAAGWEITHKELPVMVFMMGGGMWAGTRIGMHGIVDGTDQLLDESPEKNFYHCLETVPIGAKHLQLISNSKAVSGVVDITVSDHE